MLYCCHFSSCGSGTGEETKRIPRLLQLRLQLILPAAWTPLFDGTTLAGWHSYGQTAPGAAWNVDSAAIHLDVSANKGYQTKGGGDLVSNDEFENFDLKLEWKIAKNGNMELSSTSTKTLLKYKESWNTGLEMQVLDNDGHSDGKIPKHRAGNLYDLIAASP